MQNAAHPSSSNVTKVDFVQKRKVPDCEPGLQIIKDTKRMRERVRLNVLTIYKYEAERTKMQENFLAKLHLIICDDQNAKNQNAIRIDNIKDETGGKIDGSKRYNQYMKIDKKPIILTAAEVEMLSLGGIKMIGYRPEYFMKHSHYILFSCPENNSKIELFLTIHEGKIVAYDGIERIQTKYVNGELVQQRN